MKKLVKTLKGRIYLLLMIVSVVTVSITGYMRAGVESENNQVEIVLNYIQLSQLAHQSSEDINWWMAKFSDMGVTSVAIIEEKLIDYLESNFIYYNTTGDIKKELSRLEALPKDIREHITASDAFDLVIVPETEEDYNTIIEGLSRYNELEITLYDDDGYYVFIDREEEHLLYEESNTIVTTDGKKGTTYKKVIGVDILELPIGFDDEIVMAIKEAGLDVVLRPINNGYFAEDMIANYQSEVDKYTNVSPLLLPSNSEMIGYNSGNTNYVEEVYDFIKDNGYTIGLIESTIQRQYGEMDGLDALVNVYEEDNFVRVFSIWSYIQARYKYMGYEGGEEIGNAMYRGITERNIRVIYFNPFMWNEYDYVTNVDEYEVVFEELADRLAEHGYSLGRFTVLDVFDISTVLRLLLYAEVLLFALVLLNEALYAFPKRWNTIFAILAIGAAISAFFIAPDKSIKLFAFIASIVFPSLSAVVYYKYDLSNKDRKEGFISGVKVMIVSTLIALFGGVYIGSIMARTDYFLEIELFTGVKLSLLLPVMLITLYIALEYIKIKAKQAKQNFLIEMKEESLLLLRQPIQMKHGILIGIIAIIGYIYIARSGHESEVQVMQIEIVVRNFLERVLIARPRNKEFLIAFPIIILGITYKGWFEKLKLEVKYVMYLLLAGMGMIGFTAITNTFSHIRTPIYLSVVRTIISMGASIVVAFIAWCGIRIMIWLFKKAIEIIQVKVLDKSM